MQPDTQATRLVLQPSDARLLSTSSLLYKCAKSNCSMDATFSLGTHVSPRRGKRSAFVTCMLMTVLSRSEPINVSLEQLLYPDLCEDRQ